MSESENERTLDKQEAGKKRRLANLRPATKETAAARGRKGGIKSQQVQREKKTLRETLELLLSLPSKKRKGMTVQESGCIELAELYEQGNLRAWELLRDTIGQKPTEADNKHVTGNVYVSWQGQGGESIKAVSGARGAGVSIDTNSSNVVSAVEAQAVHSNTEG